MFLSSILGRLGLSPSDSEDTIRSFFSILGLLVCELLFAGHRALGLNLVFRIGPF